MLSNHLDIITHIPRDTWDASWLQCSCMLWWSYADVRASHALRFTRLSSPPPISISQCHVMCSLHRCSSSFVPLVLAAVCAAELARIIHTTLLQLSRMKPCLRLSVCCCVGSAVAVTVAVSSTSSVCSAPVVVLDAPGPVPVASVTAPS